MKTFKAPLVLIATFFFSLSSFASLPTDFEQQALDKLRTNQPAAPHMIFTGWYNNAADFAHSVEATFSVGASSCVGIAIANLCHFFNTSPADQEFVNRINGIRQQIIDMGAQLAPNSCRSDGNHV